MTETRDMKKRYRHVVILQKSVPSYRANFFSSLRLQLEDRGIKLDLVCGEPTGSEKLKSDIGTVSWAHYQSNRHLRIGRRELIWQPVLKLTKHADLVIVEQASKLLVNYILLVNQSRRKSPNVALWGHGANLQTHTASRIGELAKRWISRRARWWFAYTESSRNIMMKSGIPESQITVVQNAIDTADLHSALMNITDDELKEYRASWRCEPHRTAVFIGGLYPEKRLSFMVQACEIVAAELPGFRLIIAGDGPDRSLASELASTHQFVTFLGRVDGTMRAALLRIADTIVMPGLVGLAIVDSFVAEAPMITTRVPYHSPEIDYLEDGVNGLLVENSSDPREFAAAILRLLSDHELLKSLQIGCRLAAERYTIEEMVRRFSEGIERALSNYP